MLLSYLSRSLKRSTARRVKGIRRPKLHAALPLSLERLEERCNPAVHDLTTAMNFGTIQAAVNAANPGDTLLADAGTYAESVNINKSLILEGAQHGVDARNGRPGALESIVTGTGNNGDTPFNITANNVTIDGFTVEDATNANVFGFGIVEGGGTSGTQILNNIIQDNIAGLSLANSPSGNAGLIQHNLFQNNNQTGSISGTAIYTDQFNAGGSLANVTIDANAFTNNANAGVIIGSTDATKGDASITISNNTFNTEGNAVLLFNTTSSSITSNTITNSLASQVVIGGGVNGLQVTRNLIQNGATIGIRVGDLGGGSTNQNVTVSLNNIQGNATAGLEIDSASASFTGTLNAMCNWWGAISGPTITSNPGGLGQTIVDPANQVEYRTWLIYGTDADTIAPGFQLPATINVTEGGDISPADNDYTRLANAIGCVQSGQTLVLSGTFDWTKPFASAAWALGNDGVAGTNDDYSITAPVGVNNVTVTAASLGGATIQGPGSLTNSNIPFELPTFLAFNGGPNQNWTISNLQIFDFNADIEFGNGAGGQTAFNGTTITNNHLRVPVPLNQTVAPNAFPENVGINFSFGANQTISNNQIDLNGGGSSDSATMHFAEETGILSNTSGGNTYDGLQITGNTIKVLHAQSSDPELIRGIWENSGSSASNITVSGNQFINEDPANNPALNGQLAFQLTSASSATTTVLYQNNQVAGAHTGFQYHSGYNNTGTPPVKLIGNTLTNVFNGFDFANGVPSVDYLSGNTATGTGSAGTGIGVGAGSTLTTDGVSGTNAISGFATGVDVNGGTATLQQNTISSNGTGVSVENSGTLTATTQNFIHNNTGDGILIAASAGTVGAVTDNDLSGNGKAIVNSASALLDASLNWWGSNTRAGVQAAISGNVDYTPFLDTGLDSASITPGFQGDFSTLTVDIQSPQTGATGRIQEGINDVLAGGTVNVLSGTYAENVTIAKNLTLAGSANTPPITIIHPTSGDGVTITAPATNVTVENLEITGAADGVNADGVNASGVDTVTVTLGNLLLDGNHVGFTAEPLNSFIQTLNLSDLTLTGNTSGGGGIINVATVNYTPLTGSTGAASTITQNSIRRGTDQAIAYSGVGTINVTGSDGSDTFNVTPSPFTTFTVSGGLPTPPATPGDTLNVNLAGTTNPVLTDTSTPSGFSGSWTFGNAMPINFNEIETLAPKAPAFTSSASTTFTVGQAGTFQVTTSAAPAATLTETGALPSGVTFTDNHNGTATLAGTPAAGTGGTYTFTITAANGVTPNATQNFTLTVNEAPTITSGNAATFVAGQAGTFTVTTGHDFPTATTLSETGALPGGVTFTDNHDGTATLAGTPAVGSGGIYTLTITAANGVAPNATQTFTLTVNEAPAITSSNAATFLVGQANTFQVTTTGVPPTTVSESGALPSGVTFNATTGVLSGTPLPGTNGTYPLTFTAGNGIGTNATQSFTLTVNSRIDELGAYRASDGSWSLDSDGTPGFNSATDQVFFSFSPPGVIGVAGDWTGSGTSKIGDFSNGVWHLDLNGNGVLDPGETFTFGQAGDIPVVGDWTGNGVTNIGVFRAAPDGVTGEFILDTNGDHQFDAGDEVFTFGQATDRIVVGDWNGDGKTKVGVFRDAAAFNPADAGDAIFSLDTNGNHQFDAGDQVFIYGLATDGFVIGDWNGNGISKVGVYRPATAFGAPNTAVFSLDTNGDRQYDAGDQVFLYGLPTDQFVSGHWAKTPPVQPAGTPQAQFSANGQGPGGVAALTQAQLQPVLDQAIAAWMADGASATQLEAVDVQIGTLNDNLVGETSGNQITLDSTADGWGWNTDSSNADFTSTSADGLQAAPGSPAAGKMDLLTVVEHELGHELGLSDVNPTTHPTSLMASTLPTGTRRTVGS